MTFLMVLLSSLVATSVASRCQRVVCYYTNWAQYRPGPFKFFPENMNPRLCTHINFAFAKMNGNQLAPFEWNDQSEPWSKGMYERCSTCIKSYNPNAKLLLSVGGWNMGSEPFTAMVKTPAGRTEFATTSVSFLRSRGFDGLDLDWEYPASRGSPPEDSVNFVSLIQEIQRVYAEDATQTGRSRLLLTAAVAAGKKTIDKGYNVPEVGKYLDFINVMAYDLHGSWETFTGHNSPLYARSNEVGDQAKLNVHWAASYWVRLGLPKDKLVLGVGTYGRTFTLQSPSSFALGDPVTKSGLAGTYTREAGFLAYYEICDMIKKGAAVYREPEQKVPYLVSGNQWVGYDDAISLREKVKYMNTSGYGGIMIWAMDLDDFTGSCGYGNYSLINAIVDECQGVPGTENLPPITHPLPVSEPEPTPPMSPSALASIPLPKPAHRPRPSGGQTRPEFRQHSGIQRSQTRMFQMPVYPENQRDHRFQMAPTEVQQLVRTVAKAAFILHNRQESRRPFANDQNSRQAGSFRNSAGPQGSSASRHAALADLMASLHSLLSPDFSLANTQNSSTSSSSLSTTQTSPQRSVLTNVQRQPQFAVSLTNTKTSSQPSASFTNTKPSSRPTSFSRISQSSRQLPNSAVRSQESPRQSSFAKAQKSRRNLLPNTFMAKLLGNIKTGGRGGGRIVNSNNDDRTEYFNCVLKADGFYPSPVSCQDFFTCKGQRAFRKTCEDGLVYNPGQKYCDWPYNYKCKLGVTVDSGSSVTTGQEVMWQSSPHAFFSRKDGVYTEDRHRSAAPLKNFCNGKTNGRYSDPTTCANYIDCVSYITYVMPCAQGTVYSSNSQGCNLPHNVPECN